MNISRSIAIALVGLAIGFSATSANAGFFTDAGKKVILKATGMEGFAASAAAGAVANQQRQRREAAQADKSMYGWLKDKDYVACLQKHTNTQCNMKFYGVPSIQR